MEAIALEAADTRNVKEQADNNNRSYRYCTAWQMKTIMQVILTSTSPFRYLSICVSYCTPIHTLHIKMLNVKEQPNNNNRSYRYCTAWQMKTMIKVILTSSSSFRYQSIYVSFCVSILSSHST